MAEITSPKISIIVPVYKVEQYLRRCLDSIASQTFTDWECILIDDGSPDNSGAICDEYAGRDGRFRVIHQENKGVSAARNAGLDATKGEWIGFVDSDDWVERDYISEMLSLQERSSDVGMILCKVRDTAGMDAYVVEKNYCYIKGKYGIIFLACWGKLFRASVIEKYRIRFPENILLAEDTAFTFSFLAHSPNTALLDKYLYHYFNTRETSLVHNVTPDICRSACEAVSKMEAYVLQNHCEKRFHKNLLELKSNYKATFCRLNPPLYGEARKVFSEANLRLIFYKGLGRKRMIFSFLLATHLYDVLYPVYRLSKRIIYFFSLYVLNRIIAFVPCNTFRKACYRICGMKIGKGTQIDMGMYMLAPAKISIGSYSHINQGCLLDGRGGITIGNNVSISHRVQIMTGTHDIQSKDFRGYVKPVTIGDYAFIGVGSTILGGVLSEKVPSFVQELWLQKMFWIIR